MLPIPSVECSTKCRSCFTAPSPEAWDQIRGGGEGGGASSVLAAAGAQRSPGTVANTVAGHY